MPSSRIWASLSKPCTPLLLIMKLTAVPFPSPRTGRPVLRADLLAAVALSQAALTGCESADGSGEVITSGYHDPYYYGGYYADPDRDYVNRPGAPPHVEHYGSRPSVTPMPAARMGGGGFRR